MEYGAAKGLAVDLQFDQRINDLRYQDQQAQRAKALAEAKAKLMADDMDYQNAINSHDAPIIKQRAQNQIKEIGRFVRENPDWATNVDKRLYLNGLKRNLKDNEDLHRGIATDNAIKQYQKDLQEVAKNPQYYDTEAYKQVGEEIQNYLKYGHQNGEEAAKTMGKQAFVYSKPRDFVDMNKNFRDVGNSFKDLKTRPIKGGRNAYEEFANPASLRAVAQQMYAQNKRQIDLEARKQGVDPLTYVEQGIDAHIPKKRDFGDYGLMDAMAVAGYKHKLDNSILAQPESAFQNSFVNKQEGIVPPEFLEQTYGSTPKAVIYDNKGQNQIDITGNRVKFTGYHKYVTIKDRNGKEHKQKLAEIYTYLPLEVAKEKGIYDDGNWNPFQGEEIVPEWNRQAELVTTQNGKGEDVKLVKVKSMLPVEMNEANAGAFNQQAHIAKSKLIAQTPEENRNVPTGTIDEFKASGWSDDQIQQGLNSGKISLRR